MDIAEILVHESSHQYFYLLERLGPVDDGADARRYWSPATGSERPLRRILIAYHAFSNVWLFYQACRASNVGSDYLATNEPKIRRMITELDAPLRDNPALTALGRALHEPLAERIEAIGLNGHG
jgi:HEXXH motif-containing protein